MLDKGLANKLIINPFVGSLEIHEYYDFIEIISFISGNYQQDFTRDLASIPFKKFDPISDLINIYIYIFFFSCKTNHIAMTHMQKTVVLYWYVKNFSVIGILNLKFFGEMWEKICFRNFYLYVTGILLHFSRYELQLQIVGRKISVVLNWRPNALGKTLVMQCLHCFCTTLIFTCGCGSLKHSMPGKPLNYYMQSSLWADHHGANSPHEVLFPLED